LWTSDAVSTHVPSQHPLPSPQGPSCKHSLHAQSTQFPPPLQSSSVAHAHALDVEVVLSPPVLVVAPAPPPPAPPAPPGPASPVVASTTTLPQPAAVAIAAIHSARHPAIAAARRVPPAGR
jgi:hypothetical protein